MPLKARGELPIFGYRGFAVSQAPGAEPRFFVNQGLVDPGSREASVLDENRAMESFLLETAGGAVDDILREEMVDALQEPLDKLINSRLENFLHPFTEPVCANANMAYDAPPYNPTPWNSVASVTGHNTCYNYANDKPLGNSAIPGRAHGKNVVYTSCEGDGPQGPRFGSVEGAIADGLRPAVNFPANLGRGDGWYVAARLSIKHDDCHWIRQDSSGCWSHKNGEDTVKNIDLGGHLITDPRACDCGKYSIFCGIMITDSKVVIR